MTDAPAPERAALPISDKALAEWVVTTCLTYGTTVATAYQIAGLFVFAVTKT